MVAEKRDGGTLIVGTFRARWCSSSMTTWTVVLAASVLPAGACTSDGPRSSADSRSASITPADVARIVCAEAAIRVETPVVRAHRDGVHFVFEKTGRWWGAELHHETWDDGAAERIARFVDHSADATSSVAPGDITVACVRAPEAGYASPDAARATLTIVDPAGLYAPWDLVCGFGTQSRVTVRAGRDADPAEAYQQVPGVRASDEFQHPRYPGSAQYSAADRVLLRDGVVVARFLGGGGIGGSWDLLVNACPGTEIAGA